MVIRYILAFVAAIMFSVIGCGFKIDNSLSFDQQSEFVWQVPNGFPIPLVPAENPMTGNKVELGRQLFYDSRLSGDGSVSCAFCHQPSLAFTDGRSRAVGIQGNVHPRSAMSLTNVAYNATFGWDAPSLTRLEDQMLIPLYNKQPKVISTLRNLTAPYMHDGSIPTLEAVLDHYAAGGRSRFIKSCISIPTQTR
jgi:cytochrome c peroxidase